MIHVTLNGEPRELEDGLTLLTLMEFVGIKPELVAAQHNETIVDRKAYGKIAVNDGDTIELIRVVGGG